MKVLFIGFDYSEAGRSPHSDIADRSLGLEREINELQRVFTRASGDPVEAVFLPDSSFEEFPHHIDEHKPDIVHISAHGDETHLLLTNVNREHVLVTSGQLVNLFSKRAPPQLVYINACSSGSIARDLKSVVPMTIGASAPISNLSARSSARLFYARLLNGHSVQEAFDAGKTVLEVGDANRTTSNLFHADNVDPRMQQLYRPPTIVAKFHDGKMKPDKNGLFAFDIGVAGCPVATDQVIIFTTDETFLDPGKTSFEEDLSTIIRGSPTRGYLWCEDIWPSYGDFKLFACIVSRDRAYALSGTLCQALRAGRARDLQAMSKVSNKEFERALTMLRANDGADEN
jgi:hypothetical protein